MNGFNYQVSGQAYENYESLHKYLRHINGDKAREVISQYQQLTTNSAVEVSEKGGLSISDKTKTELTIVFALSADDNDYDTQNLTGHYITSNGTKKDFTAAVDETASTTEVAICSDFYCWNLEDYTAATVLVFSRAVKAGHALYVGTTGMVANAELRIATIAAAATYPVITTLYGAGDVYGLEESNTAGDVGKVITLEYCTPWGAIKEASFTLAANTTTIVRLTDTTTGLVCVDFYRVRRMSTTAVVGKYVAIGYDADKRVGTVAIDTFYGVIEEANWISVHSRYMVPASDEALAYIGEIVATFPSVADIITITVIFTPKGAVASSTITKDIFVSGKIELPFQLEPLSEVTIKVNDGNVAHANANITSKIIEVY